MRGNHIVWGRVQEPEPDATTTQDRERIASVELREMHGRSSHCKEAWKDGRRLGFVRVRAGGQYYKPEGTCEWLSAAYTWGESDPPWGLAILALLDQ